ncbi:helix-turn-helix domain-containing protein [Williamsia limnetica]|uniref:helix-turn-helix domain-containing protein n=1 Tax=Williamsia limnetica TaxID=882452 RepID=UPI000D7CC890
MLQLTEWLRPADAQDYLGISRPVLNRILTQNPQITVMRPTGPGGHRRISRTDLATFVEARRI